MEKFTNGYDILTKDHDFKKEMQKLDCSVNGTVYTMVDDAHKNAMKVIGKLEELRSVINKNPLLNCLNSHPREKTRQNVNHLNPYSDKQQLTRDNIIALKITLAIAQNPSLTENLSRYRSWCSRRLDRTAVSPR